MKHQVKKIEIEAFDKWSEDRGWITFTSKTIQRIVNTFFKQVVQETALNILEIGCATGENSGYLKKDSRHNIFACDISEACVRATKSKNPEIIVLVADAEALPFKSGCFNGLFLGGVLHHFTDTTMILQECKRTLYKRGLLFAFDPNRYNPIVYFYRIILGSKSMKTDNEVLLSKKDIIKKLSKIGFREYGVETSIPIYLAKDYYRACLGTYFGFLAYPCNAVEWFIHLIPGIKRYLGSFLVSYAKV